MGALLKLTKDIRQMSDLPAALNRVVPARYSVNVIFV